MVRARQLPRTEQRKNNAVSMVEKDLKTLLGDCEKILRHLPQARGPTLRFLHDNNFTMETEPMVVEKSNETLARERGRETRKKTKEALEVDELGRRKLVPSMYATLGAMRFKIKAERVMPGLDPISLSHAQICAMFSKHDSAERKKAEIDKLLEFVSGEAPSMPLNQSMAEMETLIEHLRIQTVQRGRAHQLLLPVDYSVRGVYEIAETTDDDEVYVRHRYTRAMVKVAFSEWAPKRIPSKSSTFTLERNWSEATAEVVASDTGMEPVGTRVGNRFVTHVVSNKRAIGDKTPDKASSASHEARSSSRRKRARRHSPEQLSE
eukprot:494160-Amphidinium_carterae.3